LPQMVLKLNQKPSNIIHATAWNREDNKMNRIHIVKPGKAKQTGPNRSKIIRKDGFISRAVLLDIPHDLMLKQREIQRQFELITKKKPCSSVVL
jgi:hypothetical protein